MNGWTVAEAVAWLHPAISRRDLDDLVTAAVGSGRLHPTGQRRTGGRGRPAAEYAPSDLIRLHADWVRGAATCAR